jgi:hypothetical protein
VGELVISVGVVGVSCLSSCWSYSIGGSVIVLRPQVPVLYCSEFCSFLLHQFLLLFFGVAMGLDQLIVLFELCVYCLMVLYFLVGCCL